MAFKSIMAAIVLSALSGCALSEDKVALRYLPVAHSSVVEAAKEVAIHLSVEDGRTNNRTIISRKINGFGMEMAAIRATRNPVDLVETALKQELRARGFNVGNTGLSVTARLNEFYNQYEVGLITGSAISTVEVDVLVGDPDAPRFEKNFIASQTDDAFIADGDNAKAALEAALSQLISQIMANSDFMEALVDPGGPGRPAVTPSTEDVTS